MNKPLIALTLAATLAGAPLLAEEARNAGAAPPETAAGPIYGPIYGIEYGAEPQGGQKILGRLFIFKDAKLCARWAATRGRTCERADHLPVGWSPIDAVPGPAE